MTSTLLRKAVGVTSLLLVAATVVMGLFVTPPDVVQGNLARLLYVHPPVAWVAYLAYGVTSIASGLYLWRPTRSLKWDRIAVASAEVGVVFTGLTLVTGSIWGRPAWGVWWTWDARLTTTAILFVLYLGYLALRRIP
ncbi:MAG: cytochrome c biogenesis protein CcsA, partial [Nitrospiraceae bacterium]|nr:cytochrome c biogenesis protein CcsA [Nitrospiraceae bacterium]